MNDLALLCPPRSACQRRLVAVVIPAHNEEASIARCLLSVKAAAAQLDTALYRVGVFLVLDDCSDATQAIARNFGVQCHAISDRCVGRARAFGANQALAWGAHWLAFTDADSIVDPFWLCDQLALGSDAVCGTVSVYGWEYHPSEVRRLYEELYRDRDDHRHIHGANLGVSRDAYLSAGGFADLREHEDVALVTSLQSQGTSIAWSARPRVATSARIANRLLGGFAGYLQSLAPTARSNAQN